MRGLNGIVTAVLMLSAVGSAAGEVTGTATYSERMALPPGAVFEAVLEDVSITDSPSSAELGRAAIADPGAPPFAFEIDYDPARIAPDRRYAVRTQISLDGEVLFASDTMSPVLTGGAPPAVKVGMVRVAGESPTPEPAAAVEQGLRLPGSFSGKLPCADCDSVDYRLDLWPDQIFHLRRVWAGKDMRRDAIGRWTADADRAITLRGADEMLTFRIIGPDRLEAMPRDGTAPPAAAVLTAAKEFKPFEPHLPLRGMLIYGAEEARFTECLTGRDYPLVHDKDLLALEHAYLATGEAGGPVMASFDGAIVEHPSVDGRGPVPSVLVEHFAGIWPGETCERAMGPATLANTSWKILRLGETEVAAVEGSPEPNMTLRDSDPRFSATVGCNQLTGRFSTAGDRLSFGPAAVTRMACPAPMDAWERMLAETLTETAGWRIEGQTLELTNAMGKAIALFQAVYLY